MHQKIQKYSFVSERIASELESLILFIGSEYVNKQSQDFACQ